MTIFTGGKMFITVGGMTYPIHGASYSFGPKTMRDHRDTKSLDQFLAKPKPKKRGGWVSGRITSTINMTIKSIFHGPEPLLFGTYWGVFQFVKMMSHGGFHVLEDQNERFIIIECHRKSFKNIEKSMRRVSENCVPLGIAVFYRFVSHEYLKRVKQSRRE